MQTNENEAKKNTRTLAIGFGLIVFVIALFFLKTSFFGRKGGTNSEAETANQDEKKYSGISAEDLLKKINSGEKIVIFDLRNAEDFEKEHIIDAKNVSTENFTDWMQNLEKNKEYIFVDDLGLTPQEMQSMEILIGSGFSEIIYLEGGIFAWRNKLNPLVTSGDPTSFTDQSKVTYIKSEELSEALLKENNLYIIDLRTEKEFREGHLKGAVNINTSSLEARRREIPLGKKIILYGNGDMDSFSGAVKFFDMGIFNVHTLSGGLAVWKEKGLETVK